LNLLEMGLYKFFYLIFTELSWPHNLSYKFNKLALFFSFLIDFFLISSFNIELVGNWASQFLLSYFSWGYFDLINRVRGLAS